RLASCTSCVLHVLRPVRTAGSATRYPPPRAIHCTLLALDVALHGMWRNPAHRRHNIAVGLQRQQAARECAELRAQRVRAVALCPPCPASAASGCRAGDGITPPQPMRVIGGARTSCTQEVLAPPIDPLSKEDVQPSIHRRPQHLAPVLGGAERHVIPAASDD